MAYLIRSPKSGRDWTANDLAAYNIVVNRQSAQDFFGYQPDAIPQTIDQDFVNSPIPPPSNISDSTFRLLQYIDLATHANLTQESAVHDVAREVLRLVNFEERGILLRSRYAIPLLISGDSNQTAETDLCLIHGSTTILLVVQVDKTTFSHGSPEGQVIAEAIAAFQFNNDAREEIGLDRLDSMTIPAITMTGTRPAFYKIPVSMALSDAVARGQHPAWQTMVYKCMVVPPSRRRTEGMESPEFRQEILKHYEAFRKLAKGCWQSFIV